MSSRAWTQTKTIPIQRVASGDEDHTIRSNVGKEIDDEVAKFEDGLLGAAAKPVVADWESSYILMPMSIGGSSQV